MIRKSLLLPLLLALISVVVSPAKDVHESKDVEEPASPASKIVHVVSCPGLSLGINTDGQLCTKKGSPRIVGGGSFLDLASQGTPSITSSPDGVVTVERTFADAKKSQMCRVLDRYIPEKDSIRWEVEVIGDGAPWTTPVRSSVTFAVAPGIKHWTAWGKPTGTSSPSADPLEPVPFGDRKLQYGAFFSEGVSVPLVTVMDDQRGVSVIQSPADHMPMMDLATTKDGKVTYSRSNCRIGQGCPLRFTMHLVPHASGWSPGLGWMVERYKDFFNPPSAKTWEVAGNGAYSENEGALDSARYMRMGFRVNWKSGLDYYYMGMFLPLTDDIEFSWTNARAWGAESPTRPTSLRQLQAYSERMRNEGYQVLNYFNLGEMGLNVDKEKAPPRKAAKDEDLWRDANDFVWYQMQDAHNFTGEKRHKCWENGMSLDPCNATYREFLLDQLRRHLRHIPASGGVAADRPVPTFNDKGDDGLTWVGDHAASWFGYGWNQFWSDAGKLLQPTGKVAYANPLYCRLDLYRHLDGLYSEDTTTKYLNNHAMLALRKPLITWGGWEQGVGFDESFQWHLYLGAYMTAPVPVNNHTIKPDYGASDQAYLDYGPLFDAYSARTWVLDGAKAVAAGAKANLFEVPGGFLVPVVFGGELAKTKLEVSGLKRPADLKGFMVDVLHPGTAWGWKDIAVNDSGMDLSMEVPLVRGCALVRISYARMAPARRYFYESTQVSMETSVGDAKPRFTLDGQEPTASSPLWNAPIAIKANTTVKARLFRANGEPIGGIVREKFVKIGPPAPELEPATGFLQQPIPMVHRLPDAGELTDAKIRFTTDGSEPTQASPILPPSYQVENPVTIKAKTFWRGQVSETRTAKFDKAPALPPAPTVYLSDLKPTLEKLLKPTLEEKGVSWKNRFDKSAAEQPLQIGCKVFEKGIGTHGGSELVFEVKPEWKRFVAKVGIDDRTPKRPNASVSFSVKVEVQTGNEEAARAAGGEANIIAIGGIRTIYATPQLMSNCVWGINVALPPKTKMLRLQTWNGENSPNTSHADWVDAGFLEK